MDKDHVLIDLDGIDFAYPGQPPLFKGLCFRLARGARTGIVGPNGCGKTTFFNIIMGFNRPRAGKIEIFDKARQTEKDFAEVRRRVGFLFQNSDDQLFCPSVREEVAFGPLNYRLPKPEVEKRVREALSLVGLEGFEERAPYHLSEGEKKRLAFGTLLASKPEIMLLDEPTNGIDDAGVAKIEEILKTNSFSCVIISQDRDFLKKTTDCLYTIKDGRILNSAPGIRHPQQKRGA